MMQANEKTELPREDVEIQVVLPPCSRDPLSDMLRYITQKVEEVSGEEGGWGLGGQHGYGAPWDTPVFTMRRFYWGDCDCGFEQLEDKWCSAHTHTDDCYQADLRRAKIAAGAKVHPQWGWATWPKGWTWEKRTAVEDEIYTALCEKHKKSRKFGAAAHCTCQYERDWKKFAKANSHLATCSLELPNFRHHASGFEVRWYKYIGRGMETLNPPADLTPVFNDCLRDLASVDTHPKGGDAKLGSVHG